MVAVVGLVLLGNTWFGSGVAGDVYPVDRPGVAPIDASFDVSLVVHVSGAVVDAGLVTVSPGSRVADVIAAAGGADRNADLSRLNLAAPVRDAEHVHVPERSDDGVGALPDTEDGIDLNTATAGELEELPGVGPVLAARIVGYRDEHGPFSTVEDLLDVAGIGEAKLAQLRVGLRVP